MLLTTVKYKTLHYYVNVAFKKSTQYATMPEKKNRGTCRNIQHKKGEKEKIIHIYCGTESSILQTFSISHWIYAGVNVQLIKCFDQIKNKKGEIFQLHFKGWERVKGNKNRWFAKAGSKEI